LLVRPRLSGQGRWLSDRRQQKEEQTMRKYLVLRGGSFCNVTWYLRSTFRYWREPEIRRRNFGFRIVVIRRRSNEPEK
jgi:formylglycine-generating enzyme required for sulfatase activity